MVGAKRGDVVELALLLFRVDRKISRQVESSVRNSVRLGAVGMLNCEFYGIRRPICEISLFKNSLLGAICFGGVGVTVATCKAVWTLRKAFIIATLQGDVDLLRQLLVSSYPVDAIDDRVDRIIEYRGGKRRHI